MARLTSEQWIKKFIAIHNFRYDYKNAVFPHNKKIEIICNEHGSFNQEPYVHSQGSGCPLCAHIVRNYKKSLKMDSIQKKIEQTNLKKYGCKRPLQNQKILQKTKETCLIRYGVSNPSKSKEIIAKIKLSKADYCKSKFVNKTELGKYYILVRESTKDNWVKNYDKINPNRIRRGIDNHLDHIYSVLEGFKQNIPPEIIGHWTNLQMLSRSINSSKKDTCWKSKEELLEDCDLARNKIILRACRTCIGLSSKHNSRRK